MRFPAASSHGSSRSLRASLSICAIVGGAACGVDAHINDEGAATANGTGASTSTVVTDGGTRIVTTTDPDSGTTTITTIAPDGGTTTVTADPDSGTGTGTGGTGGGGGSTTPPAGAWQTLGTTSSGCGKAATTSPSSGDMDSVSVNGTTRTFVLYVPANYDPTRAYPIVSVLHGIGATGAEMSQYIEMQVYSGNDAIVAFPDAVGGNWDLSGDTDLQFYDALTAQLESTLCVDPQRQFVLGFSLGAYMANHLGCHRPAIRSFVAADGGFPDTAANCSTSSAFIYHRQEDDNEPVQNGIDARNDWLGIDGCSMTNNPFTDDGFVTSSDSSQPTGCVQYTGCSTTPNVTWCEDTYISPEGYKHDLRDVYRVPMWNFFNALK